MSLRNVKNYVVFIFALLLSAFFYNLFLQSLHIVTGGVNGLTIILKEFISIKGYYLQFILNGLFLMIGIFFLKKKEILGALLLTFIYPVFVYLLGFVNSFVDASSADMLLFSFLAGVGIGISNGLIYKSGFTTGGVGILAYILAKKFKVSVTKINAILNCIIVFLGAFIFGFESLLYAVVVIFVSKIVSDKLFLGISNNKVFYILSSEYKTILKFLIDELGHDSTIYDVRGKYSNSQSKMIMVVVPTSEYLILREYINDVDSKAFVFVSDNYEVNAQDVAINNAL